MKRGKLGITLAAALAAGWVSVGSAQDSRFRRGDFNADGALDSSDAVAMLSYLYSSAAPPACRDAGDANDDGKLDMSDAVYVLQYLLNSGRPPRAPWPACGLDGTPDALGCLTYEGKSQSPCTDQARDTLAETIHHLTNLERDRNGLPPLKHNDLLRQAMRSHLADMAEHEYFGHTSIDGRLLTDRIDAVGYRWHAIGENISAGYTSPETAIAGWMASSSHRANLLSTRFRELGASHVHDPGSTYRHFWGQDFGTQTGVYPVVINLEALSTRAVKVSLYVYGEGWATEMQVSNDAGFPGAAWQPYRPRLDWTLKSGPGLKTVHVKLRKGTEVRTAQDQIRLDG